VKQVKRNIFISALIVVLIILSSFTCLAVSGEQKAVSGGYEATKISRFKNMLDHNHLYGNDFDDMHTVINNSCLALLSAREGNYISTDVLFPFIDNMYGIPVYCDETLNADFPRKDGAVYIVPRGFVQYEHTVTSIEEDGATVTVNSVARNVDSGEEIPCVSVFIKSDESAFGYNLIVCNLK
jgi:hypothetical protein